MYSDEENPNCAQMIAAPPMGMALTAAVLHVGVPSGFFSALRKSEKSVVCQVWYPSFGRRM
jgi:hypothetical protein